MKGPYKPTSAYEVHCKPMDIKVPIYHMLYGGAMNDESAIWKLMKCHVRFHGRSRVRAVNQ